MALRQISVTALFYLDNSRKIHLRGVMARRSKDAKRRTLQCAGEREKEKVYAHGDGVGVGGERALWLLFLYVFFFPLGLPYANWA